MKDTETKGQQPIVMQEKSLGNNSSEVQSVLPAAGRNNPVPPEVEVTDEKPYQPSPLVGTSTDIASPQSTQPPVIQHPVSEPPASTVQINEQFTGTSLNTGLWEVITYPKAYRNNEEQDYRPSQVRVNDGTLQLVASRDENGEWHSGEVHSKWNYLYGEFEVRMALSATGPGVWPAAWLMGVADQWPSGGEIDIVENVNGTSSVFGTIHGGGSNGHWQLQKTFSPINITDYHTYKIVKQPGVISWWVDGNMRGEWRQADTPAGGVWPYENQRNFGLLNLAIGGTWPGPSSVLTPDEIIMYVDYFTVKNGR